MKQPFSFPVRVYWEDTDAGGVVYHAQYVAFLERARTEWLRALGKSQERLRREHDLVFAVRAMRMDFRAPARLDDRLEATAALRAYESDMQRGLDKYLRFIEHFYDRDFLEVFLQPSERWGLLTAVVGVLAGNIFAARDNRFRLFLFFLLVKLQKHLGKIAPRISWDALPAAAKL